MLSGICCTWQGFVGVLDTWAVLWAWDQFFMQKWQPRPMEDLCLALLELLRFYFLDATNYSQMKHVSFHLLYPSKVYKLQSNMTYQVIPIVNESEKNLG